MAYPGGERQGGRCNRPRCPLARLSGLQCFNMGHNGDGINLYGVVMILMGNLHAGGQSNLGHLRLIHRTSSWTKYFGYLWKSMYFHSGFRKNVQMGAIGYIANLMGVQIEIPKIYVCRGFTRNAQGSANLFIYIYIYCFVLFCCSYVRGSMTSDLPMTSIACSPFSKSWIRPSICLYFR